MVKGEVAEAAVDGASKGGWVVANDAVASDDGSEAGAEAMEVAVVVGVA